MQNGCRELFVNAEGDVRLVSLRNPRPVPQWANRTVLDVLLWGPAKRRRLVEVCEIEFEVVELDEHGIVHASEYDEQEDRALAAARWHRVPVIVPRVIPNEVQQDGILRYVHSKWPWLEAYVRREMTQWTTTKVQRLGRIRQTSVVFPGPYNR